MAPVVTQTELELDVSNMQTTHVSLGSCVNPPPLLPWTWIRFVQSGSAAGEHLKCTASGPRWGPKLTGRIQRHLPGRSGCDNTKCKYRGFATRRELPLTFENRKSILDRKHLKKSLPGCGIRFFGQMKLR